MISAFLGLPGASKSYNLVAQGFARANEAERYIVTNFQIDDRAASIWCAQKGYKWLAEQFRKGRFEVVESDVSKLISYKNSVILMDEAGIFLTARDYSKIPDQVIINLVQTRKVGSDLFWTSQHEDLVYVNLRRVTTFFYICEFLSPEINRNWFGIDVTIPSLRILWKFEDAGLQMFRRTRKGFKHGVGFPRIKPFDTRVFSIFDSHIRLEDKEFQGLEVRDWEQKRLDLEREAQQKLLALADIDVKKNGALIASKWGGKAR